MKMETFFQAQKIKNNIELTQTQLELINTVEDEFWIGFYRGDELQKIYFDSHDKVEIFKFIKKLLAKRAGRLNKIFSEI
ncbi:MAG: hypothetical protein LBD84_07640 [Campylobacteraceae bacterium]|nr:hypothetical protein [Campylobacteraceae bacterium]